MSIELDDLPLDIQLMVKKQLTEFEEQKSVHELHDTTKLVVQKLRAILPSLEDPDEYNECQKMIRNKEKEMNDYAEIIEMEKKSAKRKKLQAKIMLKALE